MPAGSRGRARARRRGSARTGLPRRAFGARASRRSPAGRGLAAWRRAASAAGPGRAPESRRARPPPRPAPRRPGRDRRASRDAALRTCGSARTCRLPVDRGADRRQHDVCVQHRESRAAGPRRTARSRARRCRHPRRRASARRRHRARARSPSRSARSGPALAAQGGGVALDERLAAAVPLAAVEDRQHRRDVAARLSAQQISDRAALAVVLRQPAGDGERNREESDGRRRECERTAGRH